MTYYYLVDRDPVSKKYLKFKFLHEMIPWKNIALRTIEICDKLNEPVTMLEIYKIQRQDICDSLKKISFATSNAPNDYGIYLQSSKEFIFRVLHKTASIPSLKNRVGCYLTYGPKFQMKYFPRFVSLQESWNDNHLQFILSMKYLGFAINRERNLLYYLEKENFSLERWFELYKFYSYRNMEKSVECWSTIVEHFGFEENFNILSEPEQIHLAESMLSIIQNKPIGNKPISDMRKFIQLAIDASNIFNRIFLKKERFVSESENRFIEKFTLINGKIVHKSVLAALMLIGIDISSEKLQRQKYLKRVSNVEPTIQMQKLSWWVKIKPSSRSAKVTFEKNKFYCDGEWCNRISCEHIDRIKELDEIN